MSCKRMISMLLLLLSGCRTSAKDAPCAVACPPGSACRQDRCVPVCEPICNVWEYCDEHHVCRAGPRPEAGVALPPLDGGAPPADGAAPAADGRAPAAEAGAGADRGAPDAGGTAALCACLAAQPPVAVCMQQLASCGQPADCCVQPSPIPCGGYTNKWRCSAGTCERQGCSSDAECVAYGVAIQAPDAASYTCQPAACPGMRDYCAPAVKTCATDAQCCNPLLDVPCGVAHNHWRCDAGRCRYVGCTEQAECTTWAQAAGVPDPGSYRCERAACGDSGYCSAAKTCGSPADCCNAIPQLPCNAAYGNRWRCERGACVLDSCSGAADCQAYAAALSLPDAAGYACVPAI